MSPLLYQKQLRLQAARERMLMDGLDAASAGFEVGYESASQFNREYSRFFGQPPMRDIGRLGTGAWSRTISSGKLETCTCSIINDEGIARDGTPRKNLHLCFTPVVFPFYKGLDVLRQSSAACKIASAPQQATTIL